ncbi:MAG: mechanosensitive ion channel [Drouetiella hepatica Uher 2000/2452]|jgi:small-conductance mechanosensitive channel|uniref:Mechanosensitive ion channel n=1 Tax=Drouetiella hepatica Uher 2000/2452 TaxID=904376 RepID=A0A951QC59_9CYAN|nr:mechanosensitive ion channel [Drouetiella hepatica Uher 2000/2452]
MPDFIVKPDWLTWIGALVIAFPLLMFLLGEVIARLERKKRSLVAPILILRNLVLPTLALFLLLHKVLNLTRDSSLVRVVESVLWVFIIYAVLTLINIVLFEEAGAGSWQAQTPKLFLDLSRFFLILVGIAIVLSSVWGADLGGLLTALGVGSLVIGLALQDSLGNLFSGIALLFERPLTAGDWVRIGDDEGKVIEVTWRSVHLQTWSRDLLVVPNSELAKGSFKNLSRPTRLHVETFEIGFSYDDPPNRVKQILKQAALETEGVLLDPPPWVVTTAYADFYISYKIGLFAESYEKALGVRNDFSTRLWYVAKRHGLSIPYPISTEYEAQISLPTVENPSVRIAKTLNSIPSLSAVAPTLIDQLNGNAVTQDYGSNEIVVAEGDRLPGLYIVLKGHAEMSVSGRSGRQQVARLSQGDIFGEKASLLSEQVSDVSVVALDDLELMILDADTLQMLLTRNPRFASTLGDIMEMRRKVLQVAKVA